MLGKVIKYEWRSNSRMLFPMFGLALALSVVIRLLFTIAPHLWPPVQSLINASSGVFGIFVITAISLLTFVFVIIRFYQSTASKEAYLTFTLPVSVDTHLCGRLIVSTIFLIISFIVALLSAFIMIPQLSTLVKHYFTTPVNIDGSFIPLAKLPFDIPLSIFALLFTSMVVVSIANLLHVYASIAIGSQFKRGRIIASIGAFFVLNIAQSFLSLFLTFPFMQVFTNNISSFDFTYTAILPSVRSFLNIMWATLGISMVSLVVFSIAFYFITRTCFGKRLNVE